MGTTLTGTTPQDTYEALIKVGDNGIITGSLKTLSDGEGHDTALALSTGAASVTGTLAVSGNATFDTNTLFVDATNNVVGVGTVSPTAQLTINLGVNSATLPSIPSNHSISLQPPTTVDYFGGGISWSEGTNTAASICAVDGGAGGALGLVFSTGNNTTISERLRITAAGNVGIGTGTPAVPLDVTGNIRTSTGILFGSDTAAANALDDYEEGTWTIGVSFGGASVAVTADLFTGAYTKVGRKVSVSGFLRLTNKGSSSGDAIITGLPFTIGNDNQNWSSCSLRFKAISFANQFQGLGFINTTSIVLQELTEAGVISSITDADFANDSEVILSFTYFV